VHFFDETKNLFVLLGRGHGIRGLVLAEGAAASEEIARISDEIVFAIFLFVLCFCGDAWILEELFFSFVVMFQCHQFLKKLCFLSV
jgi:hypothetical protein